jgi:adenylate cyclase
MGDNVNLAARLEGLGKYYGVYLVLSEHTWQEGRVQEEFVSRVLDTVSVVGKSTGTTILTLVALRAEATAAQLQLEKLSWQMIALYRAAKFEEALTLLDAMLVLGPDDLAIQKMHNRVRGFVINGSPADWKGSYVMESK